MRINKRTIQRLVVGAAAAAAFALPSAASAQRTYNAVSDFGESRFSYGTGNGATGTFNQVTTFTPSGCLGQGSFSCYATDPQGVPTVARNNSGAAVSIGTPRVPTDFLFMHPGTATDSIVRFTSTFASLYSITGAFSRIDQDNGSAQSLAFGNNGVVVSVFLNTAAGVTSLLSSGTILPGAGYGATSGFSFTGASAVQMGVGDSLSFAVNNNGIYTYDSTGLQAVITAVPEASTWVMMLIGFGMAGGAMRRRRKAVGQTVFA